MNMKKLIIQVTLCITILSCTGPVLSQNIPVEAMIGNKNYWYQHILMRKFSSESKVGFFNVSSLYAFYDGSKRNELMSQSYLTYSVVNWVTVSVGSFYSSKPGFSPSFAIQFIKKKNNFFLLAVPRIDLKKQPTYDAMVMAEFKPLLSERTRLYFRIQLMSNYNSWSQIKEFSYSHNRSYQNVRVGISTKRIQLGIALNADEYGQESKAFLNAGAFVRTEL
jgi:hypothetical protein